MASQGSQSTPLVVELAVEEDISRLVEIEFAAYAHNSDAKLLRGRDANNPEHQRRAVWRYHDMYCYNPDTWFYKVSDRRLMTPDEQQHLHVPLTTGWLRWEHIPRGINMNEPPHARFDQYPWQMEEEHKTLARRYWSISEDMHRTIMRTRPHFCTTTQRNYISFCACTDGLARHLPGRRSS